MVLCVLKFVSLTFLNGFDFFFSFINELVLPFEVRHEWHLCVLYTCYNCELGP